MKCSECGRPAVFSTKKNRRKRSDKEHDLCERCWKSVLEKFKLEDKKKAGYPNF